MQLYHTGAARTFEAMDTSAWLGKPSSFARSSFNARIFSIMGALLPSPLLARVMLALYTSSLKLLRLRHNQILESKGGGVATSKAKN